MKPISPIRFKSMIYKMYGKNSGNISIFFRMCACDIRRDTWMEEMLNTI